MRFLAVLLLGTPALAVDWDSARLGAYYPTSEAEDPVVSRAAASVVRFPGATGVVVHEEGWILTNYHVRASFGERGQVRLAYTDASVGPTLNIALVEADPSRDVALYRVTHEVRLPAVALRAGPARVGEEVFVVGHPDGAPQRVTFGKVLARDLVIDGQPSIEYSAQTWWGSSGSPVFDRQGRMIALHWGWDANGTSNGRLTGVPIDEVLLGVPSLAGVLEGSNEVPGRCADPRAWSVRSRAQAHAVSTNVQGRKLDRVRVSLLAADPACESLVRQVTWTLHPSFGNPVLSGEGADHGVTLLTWGHFQAGLNITLADGRKVSSSGFVAWD